MIPAGIYLISATSQNETKPEYGIRTWGFNAVACSLPSVRKRASPRTGLEQIAGSGGEGHGARQKEAKPEDGIRTGSIFRTGLTWHSQKEAKPEDGILNHRYLLATFHRLALRATSEAGWPQNQG